MSFCSNHPEGKTMTSQSATLDVTAIGEELEGTAPTQPTHSTGVIDIDLGVLEPPKPIEIHGVVLLDPRTIRISARPNRHQHSFDSDDFDALRKSILRSGGNVQPIVVALLATPERGFKFELCSGERRLRACDESRLPVRAVIDKFDGALASFSHAALENSHRADPSPYEFGRLVRFALDAKFFDGVRDIARHLDRSASVVCQALQLAALPDEIVAAFPSPTELQYRDAKPLTQALKDNPIAVLAEARRVKQSSEDLRTKDVVARLVGLEGTSVRRSNSKHGQPIEVDGSRIGEMVFDDIDGINLTFDSALNDRLRARLIKNLQSFYRKHVLKKPGATATQANGETSV
jgi:ParB family chromosome partitioning protein